MTAQQIHNLLRSEYLQANTPYALVSHRLQEENGHSAGEVEVSAKGDGETNLRWSGKGNGALEALVAGLPVKAEIMDYNEHAIGAGTNAKAAAYIELRVTGQHIFSSDVYFVSNLPSELQGGDVVLICTAGFVLSFLATLYPAYRAAKIEPAHALRYS